MTGQKLHLMAILIFLIFLISSCQVNVDNATIPSAIINPTPVNNAANALPTKVASIDAGNTAGQIYTDSMQINIQESFPLQANVVINGNLADGCTSIIGHKVTQPDDWTIVIQILTKRDGQGMCTQALVPFEETIPLEVNGLPAGTYTVKVYDLNDTFTFKQDN